MKRGWKIPYGVLLGKSPKTMAKHGPFSIAIFGGSRYEAEGRTARDWALEMGVEMVVSTDRERFFYRRSNSFLQRNVIAWS